LLVYFFLFSLTGRFLPFPSFFYAATTQEPFQLPFFSSPPNPVSLFPSQSTGHPLFSLPVVSDPPDTATCSERRCRVHRFLWSTSLPPTNATTLDPLAFLSSSLFWGYLPGLIFRCPASAVLTLGRLFLELRFPSVVGFPSLRVAISFFSSDVFPPARFDHAPCFSSLGETSSPLL